MSVTCIAVKEDRLANIMSSVVSKKGIEELWASERVARFITTAGCPDCDAIKSGKRAQATPTPAASGLRNVSKMTPEGAERVDRRSEVLHERHSQRKLRETSEEERKLDVSCQYHRS